MPAMTYNFIRELLELRDRPVTTQEVIDHISKKSREGLNTIVSDILFLEKRGLIKRIYDRKLKSYIIDIAEKGMTIEKLFELQPDLFFRSLYGDD